MRLKWLFGLLFTTLLLLPHGVRAGDKEAGEPTIVVRVKSLDTVLKNVKLLVGLAGREEAAEQIEGLIKAKVGAKGLEGIDPTRPIGAYVRFGKELEDISGALLIPIVDDKAFLTLLENLNVTATKGKDDIYTIQTKNNFDLYLRFAKKYAYVSAINTDNVKDKNLLDPAKVLAGKEQSAIAAAVRLDHIPDAAKLLVMAKIEEDLQNAQAKVKPGETEVERAVRLAAARQVVQVFSDVLKEGKEVRIDVGINDSSKDFTMELSLTGQPNTGLAKWLQNIGQNKSLFGGYLNKEAAFQGLVHVVLPDPFQKAFTKAMDEAVQKGLGDIQDEAKRAQAQKLVDAVMPSLKKGEFDGYFGMIGPKGKHYTLLAAVKVADGDKLGTTVRGLISDAIKDLPADQKEKIRLDAASVGAIKIHRFELPKDPKTQKVLDDLPGDNNLYIAFRKDALLMALGKESLETLKEAVVADKLSTGPVVSLNFDVARMVPILAKTQEQKDLAAKLFNSNQEGTIHLVVDGGASLTARLSMKLNALEFFAKVKNGKDQ